MQFAMRRVVRALPVLGALAWIVPASGEARAADQAAIRQAIVRGAQYLRGELPRAQPGPKSLLAIALLKAGLPASDPAITDAVNSVREKVSSAEYAPKNGMVQYQVYEAGVDAMLLADVAGELEPGEPHPHLAELQAIARYLQGQQLPNGGWDYPPGHRRGRTVGDTSVIQYALLGLWAAERGGVRVDSTVWQKAIQWHIAQQGRDGGFAYVPGTTEGEAKGGALVNMTINAIGSTYIALMHLSPDSLPELTNPRIVAAPPAETPRDTRKFGVLERVDLDQLPGQQKRTERPRGDVPAATAQLLARAYRWLVPRFSAENRESSYRGYYYYSLERMAALANINEIGSARWFDTCADFVLSQQRQDGSWEFTATAGTPVDTAFAVLFLTRSTARILRKTVPVDPIGGGLLSGGRGGLDGKKDAPRSNQPLGSLDEMLAALDAAGELELQEVQEQLIEQVQIGDRQTLVGRKDLLLRYVRHPNAEVRRTAAWALGRTDDLSLGRYLIEALEDADVSVVVEARNALCWLARKPNGLGEPADPFSDMPPDANEDQLRSAETAWRTALLRNWGRWYLQNRPYADRGDEFEAELLQKLGAAG